MSKTRGQPSGMGTARGPVARRLPITLPPCRGCGADLQGGVACRVGENERGHTVVFCAACGIEDPAGGARYGSADHG